jgi:hypothetical protein
VLKHRFIYYYFKGYEMFKYPLVRHLNDIPSDNKLGNLKAGTHKENMADIPRDVRSKAMTPERIEGFIERSRRLSNEQVVAILKERLTHKTPYYKLAEKYGVATMTIQRLCVGTSWKTLEG